MSGLETTHLRDDRKASSGEQSWGADREEAAFSEHAPE
jgi:hypothetical protein